MIEIRATQAKRVFTFHKEEIALPFHTPHTENRAGWQRRRVLWTPARIRCCFVVLSCLSGSTVPNSTDPPNLGGRTHLCRDRQCGQCPGTREGTFPSMSSRFCLRYSAQTFSSRRVWSFDAIPNRATARIKARTLTWGSAAGPVVPHLRQVTIGVWMLRLVRIR